jgi:hypothetical protein
MSKHHNSSTETTVPSQVVLAAYPNGTAASGRTPSAKDHDREGETARLAYSYWEARGRSHGSAEKDWLRAEQEMKALRL